MGFSLVLSYSEPLCMVLIGNFEDGRLRSQALNLCDSLDPDWSLSDWSYLIGCPYSTPKPVLAPLRPP